MAYKDKKVILSTRSVFHRYPRISAPLQTAVVGVFLTFMTPLCCALFPQNSSIKVGSIEQGTKIELYRQGYNDTDYLYYNKGL